MADYESLTTWLVDAPVEPVFDVLHDAKRYPEWWRGVRSVEMLSEGDEDGVGEVDRFSWRSLLPYTLEFDVRVVGVERPYLIEGAATGELEGSGTWRLFAGSVYGRDLRVAGAHDPRVDERRGGPLARPAFAWNHDHVMRQGGHGLAGLLGAQLLAHD